MLNITDGQFAVLDEDARGQFHRSLCAFLRDEFPEKTDGFDQAQLTARIVEGETRAKLYEIVSQAGVAQFVCLMFAGRPDFDEVPEIHAYLTQPDISGEDKISELVNLLALGDVS